MSGELREIPPTAGLPPRWRDLWPARGTTLARCAARFLGVEEVQVECSGTAALVVALTTLKRRHPARRRVIVPAYTCPLVAIAVAHCELELQLCDLLPGGIDMDGKQLASLCDEATLAIVPTHLGGRVADVDAALACARRVGACVIEDAAQALGARWKDGTTVGARGDIGFFSLAVGKGLTTFEGGLLIARDATLREALRRTSEEIVPRRMAWEFRRSAQLLGYHALYNPRGLIRAYGNPRRRALRKGDWVGAVGDDFPLTIPLHTLGAWRQSVGARAFARLAGFLREGRERARARIERLRQIAGIEVLDDSGDAPGVWPFLFVLMPRAATRDAALDELWASPLGVSRLFIHALPDYGYLAGLVPQVEAPNARDFAARTLTISNSPWLDDAGFAAICAALDEVTRRSPR